MYCEKGNPTLELGDLYGLPNSIPIPPLVHCGEPRLVHNVVLKMVMELANLGHLVIMDNFFLHIGLFMNLLSRGIYALWTVKPNHVGLPLQLEVDVVFLISTHALPIQAPCEFPILIVPRVRGIMRVDICTSPLLLKYTIDMWKKDVTNQLHALYSFYIHSHKWWHCIFFFLLNLIVVNIYIIHLHCFEILCCEWRQQTPMTYLRFKLGLCHVLLNGWAIRIPIPHDLVPNKRPLICTFTYSTIRRPCSVYYVKKPNFLCYK